MPKGFRKNGVGALIMRLQCVGTRIEAARGLLTSLLQLCDPTVRMSFFEASPGMNHRLPLCRPMIVFPKAGPSRQPQEQGEVCSPTGETRHRKFSSHPEPTELEPLCRKAASRPLGDRQSRMCVAEASTTDSHVQSGELSAS